MSKKVITFYSLAALVLAIQVVYTVYQGSLVVNYGPRLAQLEAKKEELSQARQQLQYQMAGSSSLMTLTQTAEYNQFQPISQTVKLTAGQTVASR